MASVGEFRPIAQVAWTNLLPGKPADKLTSGTEKLGARYKALSRLSKSLAAGTPEDWIQDLVTDLRGMFPLDLLDVVVYQKDGSEIHWRLPASRQSVSQDRPMEETLLGYVYQDQRALRITDCNTDEGCSVANQRLKSLEL